MKSCRLRTQRYDERYILFAVTGMRSSLFAARATFTSRCQISTAARAASISARVVHDFVKCRLKTRIAWSPRSCARQVHGISPDSIKTIANNDASRDMPLTQAYRPISILSRNKCHAMASRLEIPSPMILSHRVPAFCLPLISRFREFFSRVTMNDLAWPPQRLYS